MLIELYFKITTPHSSTSIILSNRNLFCLDVSLARIPNILRYIPSPYIYISQYLSQFQTASLPPSRKEGGKKRRKRKLIQRRTVTRTKASSSSSPLYKGPDRRRCEKKRRCRKSGGWEGYGSYGDDGKQFRKVSPQIFHGPHPDPHKSLRTFSSRGEKWREDAVVVVVDQVRENKYTLLPPLLPFFSSPRYFSSSSFSSSSFSTIAACVCAAGT